MMGLDIMYTIKEVHEKLNCNRQTINNWIKRLNIDVATIDGMYRLTEEQYNMIADKVNTNRNTNTDTNGHTNRANVHTDGANNTNQDTNNNTESNNVVEILQSHIEEQRNTIRDLSRMLDQQQQLTQSSNKKILKLESELEQYRLEDNSSNEDNNRSIKVKRYKVYSSDKDTRPTDANVDVSNTNDAVNDATDNNVDQSNINDVDLSNESNNDTDTKPRGFFKRLFGGK